jgi:hypothetical protein
VFFTEVILETLVAIKLNLEFFWEEDKLVDDIARVLTILLAIL